MHISRPKHHNMFLCSIEELEDHKLSREMSELEGQGQGQRQKCSPKKVSELAGPE